VQDEERHPYLVETYQEIQGQPTVITSLD
jgi:hypothetical protein